MTGQPQRPPFDFVEYLSNYHIRTFPRALVVVAGGFALLSVLDWFLYPAALGKIVLVRAAFLVPIALIHVVGFRHKPGAVVPLSLLVSILLGWSVTATLLFVPRELFLPAFILDYILVLMAAVLLFPLRLLEYGILVAAVWASYLVVAKPRVPGESVFVFQEEDSFYFCIAAVALLAHVLRQKGLALGYLGECYRYDLEAANVELQLQRQELAASGSVLEQTVADRTRLLQTVLNATPAAVISLERDGKIATWNRTAGDFSGIAPHDAIGRNFLDLVRVESPPFGEEWVDAFRVCLAHGTFLGRLTLTAAKGDPRTLVGSGAVMQDEGGSALGLVLCAHDITERARLERELIHSQRMEIVGQLAGGVTHSFNNLLVGILAVAQALLKRDLSDDVRAGVARIERFTWNAAKVAEQFLTFSRKCPRQTRREDLVDVVRRSVDLLVQVKKKGVEMKLDLPEDGMSADLDASDVEQAVLNVLMNANHAVPANGWIRVALARARFDAADLAARPWARADADYGRDEIADNGPGIAPAVLGHIFEPFFTTKPEGMGTGLGMTIADRVIRDHGGSIEVESRQGEGTTFCLYLPLARRSNDKLRMTSDE